MRVGGPCAAVVLGLLLAAPVNLEAHAHLKSSTPAKGADLSVTPRARRLDLTESRALGPIQH